MAEYHIFRKGSIPENYTLVDEYEEILLSGNVVNDKKLKASIRTGEHVLGIKKSIPEIVVNEDKKTE